MVKIPIKMKIYKPAIKIKVKIEERGNEIHILIAALEGLPKMITAIYMFTKN